MDGSLRQWASLGTVACSCVVSGSCTNTTGGSVSLWLKIYKNFNHTIFTTVYQLNSTTRPTTGFGFNRFLETRR